MNNRLVSALWEREREREAGRFFKHTVCECEKWMEGEIKRIILEFPLIRWKFERNYEEGLELIDRPPPITTSGEPEAYK